MDCLDEVGKIKKEALINQATRSKERIYNSEWIMALENESMLKIVEIIASTSLMREESRGGMYRRDFPDTDNKNWLKNILVKQKNGHIQIEARPVVAKLLKLPKREKIPYLTKK